MKKIESILKHPATSRIIYTWVCTAGDGIDAVGCDTLRLSSLSGTGLEKNYKFYGDRDSQSVSVVHVKSLQIM